MSADDETHRRDRTHGSGDSGDPNARKPANVRAAMRARGLAKVVCITIAVSQVLTTAFAGLAHAFGHDVEPGPLLLFNFVTCALVGFWLQSDAQRAYLDARASGRLRKAPTGDTLPDVPTGCPKRWLVILNIELNPHLLDEAK